MRAHTRAHHLIYIRGGFVILGIFKNEFRFGTNNLDFAPGTRIGIYYGLTLRVCVCLKNGHIARCFLHTAYINWNLRATAYPLLSCSSAIFWGWFGKPYMMLMGWLCKHVCDKWVCVVYICSALVVKCVRRTIYKFKSIDEGLNEIWIYLAEIWVRQAFFLFET